MGGFCGESRDNPTLLQVLTFTPSGFHATTHLRPGEFACHPRFDKLMALRTNPLARIPKADTTADKRVLA